MYIPPKLKTVFATKEDLDAAVREVRGDFDRKLAATRSEVSTDFDRKLAATRSEMREGFRELRDEFSELRKDFSQLLSAVDGYAKRTEAFFQEMVMLSREVDRHERWLKQIADKIGIHLEI